ncbi:MAG: MDR family MFS transporter [Promethearchaeota archaeon]
MLYKIITFSEEKIMLNKVKKTYREFPDTFWVLTFSSFIDNIGSFMLMPFIALYLTESFGITMVQMGIIYIIVGIGNMIGGMIGGVLTDKFGRKRIALFGLLSSGAFSLLFMFITDINILYYLVGFMGLLGSLGGPARQAMLADILPPKQRTEGFGILRVVVNLSATIGPALGGFLAGYDFRWLFLGDAISSLLTAIIFAIKIPETSPTKSKTESKIERNSVETTEMLTSEPVKEEKSAKKSGGYGEVFRDWKFMIFVGISMVMVFVYMNMNGTLPVFLRDNLGMDKMVYGYLISMNAFMVVIMQFWITRKIKLRSGLVMMAVGNLLYGIGFGMYGIISTIPMVYLAMIIITIGEMIVAPFSQSIPADFAPEDKRGRYMAISGFSGLIPMMFGVIGAGAIIDSSNPHALWYLCFILSLVAMLGYLLLNKIMPKNTPGDEIASEMRELGQELPIEVSSIEGAEIPILE